MKANLKQIMTKAWAIARNAVKQFGGKALQYIREAMKMAWSESRVPVFNFKTLDDYRAVFKSKDMAQKEAFTRQLVSAILAKKRNVHYKLAMNVRDGEIDFVGKLIDELGLFSHELIESAGKHTEGFKFMLECIGTLWEKDVKNKKGQVTKTYKRVYFNNINRNIYFDLFSMEFEGPNSVQADEAYALIMSKALYE